MFRVAPAVATGLLLLAVASPSSAQTLKGSHAAMNRQHRIARKNDFTFLRTAAQVRHFVDLGLLVRFRGNEDYELARVSFPYGRPALHTFVERLAAQYHAACGEKLVVTSLTRPLNRQPRNASDLSVHPTGMAVDLRHSRRSSCRRWLQQTLLYLEGRGVLDVTQEHYPPHYHVALFPDSYTSYVAAITSRGEAQIAAGDGDGQAYVVSPGDSLWGIARKYGTTVEDLKEANSLEGSRIAAGQVLTIPTAS